MKRHFKLDITNKQYRSVLLLSYSTIAIIAIAIVLTGLFSWFNVYTQRVIYNLSMTQLQNLDTTISNNLDMWRTQLQTAWQDANIKQHIYTQSDSWKTENWIGSYLQRLCVNNGFAEYVCLFRSEDEFRYYGWRYPEEAEIQQIEQRIMETQNDTQQFIIETSNRKNLCIFLTDRKAMGVSPQRGIIYSLDLDQMEKKLISQKIEDSILLVYTSDGQSIINGKLSDERVEQIWNLLQNQDMSSPGLEIVLDESKYLCNSLYNDVTDMHFVMLQDYHIIQTRMTGMKKAAFISVVASLFIALLLAVILANKLYYPLQDFFSKIGSGPEILPGNEEYSRQQAEITSERIISQIHMMSQQYHSDKILWFLGGEDTDTDIPPVLRLQDRGEHCLFLLYWTNRHYLDENFSSDIYSILERNHSGCKISAFADTGSPWLLILLKEPVRSGSLSDWNKLQPLLEDECTQMAKVHGTQIFYAVSALISEEKDLRPNFQELQMLLKYHLLGQSRKGMTSEIFEDRKKLDIPKKIYDDFLERIKKGKTEEAIAQLPLLLDELSSYNIKKVLLSLSELCVQIEQCIFSCELTGKQRQENYLDHYIKITSLYDRSDLENYLKHLTEEICFENSVFQEKTLRMNMLDAVEYIQEHYRDEDICVEQVAERFHMSVSYFSKLFNEYAGMTFPEFITDLRLTYAKEMLRANPDINIKKVAEICGFSTTSYFSSQFKKKFGLSPSAVRNS